MVNVGCITGAEGVRQNTDVVGIYPCAIPHNSPCCPLAKPLLDVFSAFAVHKREPCSHDV